VSEIVRSLNVLAPLKVCAPSSKANVRIGAGTITAVGNVTMDQPLQAMTQELHLAIT